MTSEDLEKLYYSKSNEEVAKDLEISIPTLLKRIDKAGIPRKGSGRPYANENIESIYTSNATYFVQKKCGTKAFGLFMYLITDKTLVKNNWDGLSSVDVNDFEKDNIFSILESLLKNDFISQYKIIDNKIYATISNRGGFVITESEYVKMGLK